MAKGPMYVKDFDFSVQPCNYSHGGAAKSPGQKMTNMASGGYYAKGGMKKAMVKRESMETPRMQKEEMVQSRMVRAPAMPSKAPMRRAMPVAPVEPMIQLGAMKKGGAVANGSGMVKTTGSLGIKGNKNPGERNGTPTTSTKTGNVPYSHGGNVKKYAEGGTSKSARDYKTYSDQWNEESYTGRALNKILETLGVKESKEARADVPRDPEVKKYADGGPMMPGRPQSGRASQEIPPEILRALQMAAMKAQAGRGRQQGGMPMRRSMPAQMPPQMGAQPAMLAQMSARPAMRSGGGVSKKK